MEKFSDMHFREFYSSKNTALGSSLLRAGTDAIRILTSSATDAEKADLAQIDLESLLSRYQEARYQEGKPLDPLSLTTYRGRLRKTFTYFFNHVQGGGGSPLQPPRRGSPPPNAFPRVIIRPGLGVELVNLPFDLTRSEADKLCAAISAYARETNTMSNQTDVTYQSEARYPKIRIRPNTAVTLHGLPFDLQHPEAERLNRAINLEVTGASDEAPPRLAVG